tara:strand:+ start:126 stop:770 length:645 start_codon:yes stop_codon:yes gene_type:complete
MTINSHFNTTSYTQEQDLIGNLVAESIQMVGQDFTYLPRTLVKKDTIFNEDTVSSFTGSHVIEMHIENTDGFGGGEDMLSQFGLDIRDQLILNVSTTRFLAVTSLPTPLVGDLIYWPLLDQAFEIKFVEDEVPFYQLGKNHIFQITTELFSWSHETVNTGITEIDDNFTAPAALVDSTVDNVADPDNSDLVPLSTTVTDDVIDFTTGNPFSEGY